MARNPGTTLRPMRVRRPLDHLGKHGIDYPRPANRVPGMPDRIPARAVAPDRLGDPVYNGSDLPPADLHIALLVPDRKTYDIVKRRVHVIKPPYWPGRVHLHAIVNKDLTPDDAQILQAVVDLGWATSDMTEIGPPAQLALGYETDGPDEPA